MFSSSSELSAGRFLAQDLSDVDDERVQSIREAVSRDGTDLEAASEQKLLLHVWEKLQRTEDALKDEIAQVKYTYLEQRSDILAIICFI